MCSMKRVLPQPVGPFSIIGMRLAYAAFEQGNLVADSTVIGLIGDAVLINRECPVRQYQALSRNPK